MQFKEFAKNINKLLKEHPEIAKFEVITSIDDEGNSFNTINYFPTIGRYNSKKQDFKHEIKSLKKKSNAVCVN